MLPRPMVIGQQLRTAARRTLEQNGWGQGLLDSRKHRRTTAFYRNFLGPDSLCFDIGANIGERTELFRAIGARTVAVEPQSSCVRELRLKFGDDPRVTVAAVAVGSSPGFAEIAVCDKDSTISTMATHWQTEGRFADREWNRSESVQVTTLDQLVDEHGRPAFCKVDVEGFEVQVFEGLSSPLPCASFEFTQEFLENARSCVALLASLGPVTANAAIGESMRLMGKWTDPDRLFATIERHPDDLLWGDIYVRSLGA